jgi:hypothetical protein
MKSKKLSLLIATGMFFASVSTFASAELYGINDGSSSKPTKTRAEVVTELKLAQQNGGLTFGEKYPQIAQPATNRSRDAVRAEAVQAAQDRSDLSRNVNSIYFGG